MAHWMIPGCIWTFALQLSFLRDAFASPAFAAVYHFGQPTSDCSVASIADSFVLYSEPLLRTIINSSIDALCDLDNQTCLYIPQLSRLPVRIQCLWALSQFETGWDYSYDTSVYYESTSASAIDPLDFFAGRMVIQGEPTGLCRHGSICMLNSSAVLAPSLQCLGGCSLANCTGCSIEATFDLDRPQVCSECTPPHASVHTHVDTTTQSFYIAVLHAFESSPGQLENSISTSTSTSTSPASGTLDSPPGFLPSALTPDLTENIDTLPASTPVLFSSFVSSAPEELRLTNSTGDSDIAGGSFSNDWNSPTTAQGQGSIRIPSVAVMITLPSTVVVLSVIMYLLYRRLIKRPIDDEMNSDSQHGAPRSGPSESTLCSPSQRASQHQPQHQQQHNPGQHRGSRFESHPEARDRMRQSSVRPSTAESLTGRTTQVAPM
ncbi:uncharacterized protein BJ171DRAFT_472034 [Polychytrium aggregatum]|uniref:uncharacterized protein n=1 Tax=Polychytrium aggregatum TaxID=110093 RepID=UPI0022FEF938|nr:uncharacterized protein BJ171DRAFT_472034 [Polychytrium aggregatum]KAI9208376.1 hypothetical protein BJ171DRAFT_472034 [Polychytrium aggregatum]